jgi:KRAB domain-containing zinc finger protein
MLVHTGGKPHTCNMCDKSFTEAWYLKLHRLVHTGEKPHSCNVCGKSFAWTASLRKHKSIHREITPS